jgi:hypothetical protein
MKLLGWLCFAVFLSGCSSPYLFGPTQYGSSSHLEYQDRTRGGLGGDAEGMLFEKGTESIIVGWEHFSEGARIHNHIYRGAVKFNVNLLNEPPKKTITNATLNYTIQSGANVPSLGFIESCADQLLLASGAWKGMPEVEPGKAPSTIPGEFLTHLPGGVIGTKERIDVTSVVKDWVSGKKENHGFVFASNKEEEGLIENNNKCWTMLGDFTLKIEYTKP